MHAVLISSESASSVCAHFAVGMRSEVSTTRWSVGVDSATAESSVVAADDIAATTFACVTRATVDALHVACVWQV